MEHQGEHIYSLKIDTLISVLSANQQTCQILAEVPFGTLIVALGNGKVSRERGRLACVIALSLHNGQVVSAIIHDQIAQTFAVGEHALLVSRQCGDLCWVVRPMHPPYQETLLTQQFIQEHHTESPHGPSAPGAWFGRSPPYLTHRPTSKEVETLPRKSRQVLMLIDGKRGINELCRILNCQPDQLTTLLDELITKQLIAFPDESSSSPTH